MKYRHIYLYLTKNGAYHVEGKHCVRTTHDLRKYPYRSNHKQTGRVFLIIIR